MMQILSHRGYWKAPDEKNERIAFERSFSLGFGTEIDVRDCLGALVIAHDMPGAGAMPLPEVLSMAGDKPLTLAINVKADGLAHALARTFRGSRHDWFVFDMSIPDMRKQLDVGNPVFVRVSEVEREPPWIDEAQGVWLDAFSGDWYGLALVQSLLGQGLKVCVVSPELHQRNPMPLWQKLYAVRAEARLMLCTDRPEEAQQFFANERSTS
jgi:hypothetical protein